MQENVIWKRLIYHGKDLGDFYLVSNTGEIKGVKTGKVRLKNVNKEGYYFVSISLGSRENKQTIKIHRAVAETFLTNDNNYPTINHKDGNKLNNNVKNLEFCSCQYNVLHAIENNLFDPVECGKLTKNNRKIMSLNNNKIYNSITEAGMEYDVMHQEKARKNISRALNSGGTAYGKKWIYIEKDAS